MRQNTGIIYLYSYPPSMHAIADNLKRLRKARNWTQADLANRAGLARATLASMEQPEANPGILAVQAVARALEVRIEELVDPPPASRIIIVQPQDCAEFRTRDGLFVARMVSPVTATGLQLQHVTMYPGCHTVGRPHPAGSQEFFLVLSGQAHLIIADEAVDVEAGGLIQFPGHLRHVYANRGEHRLEAVSAVSMGAGVQ